MKIYCRKTKRELAEPDEKFRTIEIAINFFEKYFSCKFPFKKYDMVFVPEFRINGMENVGIVIMRDTFMRPQEEKTFFEYMQWYKVAVHELSHMWFGDLVTMKWWNDLWLKESFAEYSTIVCLTECEEFSYVKNPNQIGLHFLWEALNDDTKRTTHPIQVTVNHTNDAINMYDKICYRKGACFLKQIDVFVGRHIMREGIMIYFRDFKFKTTTLQDFINCLKLALQKNQLKLDLQAWVDSWLTKSGVNELTPRIVHNDLDNSYSIDIIQSLPRNGDKIYHEQKLEVVVYDQDVNQRTVENVHIQGEALTREKVSVFKNKPCAILVNGNLKGYCRTVLDQESLHYFLQNLSKVKDDLNRSYIWRTLWDNLKIKVLTGEQFLQCVLDHFLPETEEYTMPVIIQTIQVILKYHLSDRPDLKTFYQNSLLALFKAKLATHCPTKSMEVLLLQEIVQTLMSADDESQVFDAVTWLRNLKIELNGGDKVIELDKLQRYMLLKLVWKSQFFSIQEKQKLLQRERSIEFGDVDDIENYGVQSSLSEEDMKLQLFNDYTKPNT